MTINTVNGEGFKPHEPSSPLTGELALVNNNQITAANVVSQWFLDLLPGIV